MQGGSISDQVRMCELAKSVGTHLGPSPAVPAPDHKRGNESPRLETLNP